MRDGVDDERGLIAWFAKNTVAANLLMSLILLSGLITLPVIRKEVFPETEARMITVSVAYPGAAPAEVEEAVCQRIEEAVQGVSGIKRVTSTAAEDAGAVTVEVLPSADVDEVLADVKNRVDAIDTFPLEAEKPIVQQLVVRRQVINVAISGDVDERILKRVGERVRDDLARLPEITQVELVNVRADEISIEVSEPALRRHNLTFDAVAQAVRRSSLDLAGGSIKTQAGEVLLRADGQAHRGEEFEDLVLITRPDGTRVTLGQVATVVDGFADVDQSARFDGRPAALVQVYRVGDQSALDIARAVHDYIAATQPLLTEGITLTPWRDYTELLQSRMDLLLNNAASGLLLVFGVLALFLRFRLAFWVALGVPVAFLGAIALMPTFDVSFNMISLFAFIVVLGIVVDDAIVVGENVYKRLREGESGRRAAIIGSKEVAVPVTFGVLTTVAAFWPMLNVDADARDLWRQIPLIVIPCLLISLAESKLILPAHLSHERPFGARPQRRGLARVFAGVGNAWRKVQEPAARGLEWFAERVFAPVSRVTLRWRYATWAASLSVFGVSLTLVAAGWIRFEFFPTVEGDNVVAQITMPLGAPVEVTARALHRIESAARQVEAEIDREHQGGPHGAFRHVLTSVGEQPYKLEMSQNAGRTGATLSGSHLGEVNVQLWPAETRSVSAEEVLTRWRDKVSAIPEAVELKFTSSVVPSDEDINIQLSSRDIDTLRRAADQLKQRLAGFVGVEDITDTLREGKPEIVLAVRPRAETLGLTLADLARQVRQAFYGEEAQRLPRGREDVPVMVRYPQANRRSLADLEQMRIRTAAGDEVPLSVVATAEVGRGYATIKRTDMARTTNVTAEVDSTKTNANQVIASLRGGFLDEVVREHPGLAVSFEGDTQEQERTLSSLLRGAIVALLAIYALMAVPLRSYLQPLIVMIAVPFGLVGAAWGHVIMGMNLSIISMLGLVALTGVVVNDSLVLVNYINGQRRAGHDDLEVVHRAGVARFRPILLTSLTTFAGLTPMLLERSVQAKFLMPMAVSLAFGVMFSTVISLLLVPASYLILNDLRRAGRWLLGRRPAAAAAQPAAAGRG
jgi:multidrug efflux pump subunit AcrB